MNKIRKMLSENRVTKVVLNSGLRRNISTVIISVFYAGVIVGIIASTLILKPDKIFDAGILAVALVALLVANVGLDLARRDFTTRDRPFVSFGEISGDGRPNTTQLQLHIPIQNTGICPAEDVRITTSSVAADTGKTVSESESRAPKLAPNQHYTLNVDLEIPKVSPAMKDDSKTILQLHVKYKGLNKSYEWKQKYRMQLGTKTVGEAMYNYLEFIPTE